MRALLVALLVCGCATGTPEPTREHPMMACAISCPWGFSHRPQHACRGGQRYFQDVLLKGRHTTRGADGAVLTDVYETDQGDYAAVDVERGTCSTVIARIIASRSIEQRGQHPGEDAQGNPEPPQ